MLSKDFPCKVIGKTIEKRGWLIKNPAYVIAIQIQTGAYISVSKDVPFHQYCLLEVGNIYDFEMYSDDGGHTWFFSAEE